MHIRGHGPTSARTAGAPGTLPVRTVPDDLHSLLRAGAGGGGPSSPDSSTSAHDAQGVALAERLDAPPVTADARLSRVRARGVPSTTGAEAGATRLLRQENRPRMSSALRAPLSAPPSSSTRANRSRLRPCSAMTFSSIVPVATSR